MILCDRCTSDRLGLVFSRMPCRTPEISAGSAR